TRPTRVGGAVIPADVSEQATDLAKRDASPSRERLPGAAALGVLFGGPVLQRAALKGASK
ncbi:hypothetical protein UFOVP314_1, partial [uncultured Caudovirales phage]